jgi:hypothetical protein
MLWSEYHNLIVFFQTFSEFLYKQKYAFKNEIYMI